MVKEHEAAFLVEYHFDLFQLMKTKIALAEKWHDTKVHLSGLEKTTYEICHARKIRVLDNSDIELDVTLFKPLCHESRFSVTTVTVKSLG